MRVAAAVILYHPAQNAVANIKTYYDYIEKVYVFDNTEDASAVKDDLLRLPKVEYYHNHKNEGIARRLNDAAEKALANQFDWLLTMDQDTSFANDTIKHYFNCFYSYHGKEHVAMFGTKYHRINKPSSNECVATDIHELITSASLLNLALYKTIGRFDEALFIDSVDHDYCIRAKLAGFALIEFSNIHTLHEVGRQVYKSSIKTLFTVKKKKEIHSPLRCYYMYRNLLYLEQKHKHAAATMKVIRNVVVSQLKACIFYGEHPLKVLRYVAAAYNDYKHMRMGKNEKLS